MSIGIIILSVISGLAAMICGCIGVVSDFRDPENGRLRKIGLINLIILLTGSAFSVAALSLGFFKELEDDDEQRDRFQATLESQERILNGIKRSIRPIGSAIVSVEIIYDENSGYPGASMIALAKELRAIPKFVRAEKEGTLFFNGRIENIENQDFRLQNSAQRWNAILDQIEETPFEVAIVRGDQINPDRKTAMTTGDFLANREGLGAIWQGGLAASQRKMSISMDNKTNTLHVFFDPEQYGWVWSNGSISYIDDLRDSQWYIESPYLGEKPSGFGIITRVRLGSWQGVPLLNELTVKNWTFLDADDRVGGKRSLWHTKVVSSEITKAFGN